MSLETCQVLSKFVHRKVFIDAKNCIFGDSGRVFCRGIFWPFGTVLVSKVDVTGNRKCVQVCRFMRESAECKILACI